MKSLPRFFTVARAVGTVTFTEIVRDKVLYNILVVACLLLGVSYLASQLTYTGPERIILDLGLASVVFSCVVIGVLMGAGMLGRELERRTLYVALAHPVTRGQFLAGKFAGLAAVLALNWLLLSSAYLVILAALSPEPFACFSTGLFYALAMALVQSWIVAALAVFFSTRSTGSLSVMMTLGLYLVGTNVSHLRALALKSDNPGTKAVLAMVASVVPDFERFSLGTQVTYGLPVGAAWVVTAGAYGLCVIGLLLVVSSWLLQGREV